MLMHCDGFTGEGPAPVMLVYIKTKQDLLVLSCIRVGLFCFRRRHTPQAYAGADADDP